MKPIFEHLSILTATTISYLSMIISDILPIKIAHLLGALVSISSIIYILIKTYNYNKTDTLNRESKRIEIDNLKLENEINKEKLKNLKDNV